MSELVVARSAHPEDPLLKWRGRGRLPHGETVDAYVARIRNGVARRGGRLGANRR